MGKQAELGTMVKERLSKSFAVRKEEIGADAQLSKKGMAFTTESYTVEGIGHLCIMKMKAMLGLMKMETVVLSTFQKDVPLINLDRVSAFGKETMLVELYDTQLEPFAESAVKAFDAVRAKDADIADYTSGTARWYDDILYPCSYRKTGKGTANRMFSAAKEDFDIFAAQLEAVPDCDPEAKKAKVKAFAETLFAQGGPAVDQVTKLFGKEIAGRLILKHMYGV